ncbi:MAG TPA: helix-turn-helix transcriptional regulator [Candidatus Woesebacteria bacterium]|nr:helix-turn-helix transcriptional regulator [Candidatus Woesebacteria bacterium]
MISKEKLSKLIGKRIREEREKRGLSQEALAGDAGLYRTYVGHLENGRYMPTIFTIYRVAEVLKIDPLSLLKI